MRPFDQTPLQRRSCLKRLAGFAAASLVPGISARLGSALADTPAKPLRIIVDADTANEIDDAFALARALMEPCFRVEGITSAQWHTQEQAPRDTVGPSQQLNEELLRAMSSTPTTTPTRSTCSSTRPGWNSIS